MSRIVLHEPCSASSECRALLAGEGHEVVACASREALIGALAERRPDALVYILGDLVADLGVLTVVRRAARQLPLILLGGPANLEMRRMVQELRPTYYALLPLEPSELREAVLAAITQRNGRTRGS